MFARSFLAVMCEGDSGMLARDVLHERNYLYNGGQVVLWMEI
jgi:hypothetical protein